MIRALALALVFAAPAGAQPAPQVEVTLDPQGAVTVGAPLRVTATVLVPTYMPQPPAWPDLQIADAITRLPERASRPVTQRIGRDTWSGVARSWEIIAQRAADYDLGPVKIGVTYADPAGGAPLAATVATPPIAFSATVPAGAEGMDPFLAATDLAVVATVDGLPDAPAPGDAFSVTLTTTAHGPPAMLLPPLASQLPTPDGLRAYPRQPALTDAAGPPPSATRVETVAYVIERPGRYVLPGVGLDWWSLGTGVRATATTGAIAFEVAAPAGWSDPAAPGEGIALGLAAAAGVATAAALALLAWRRRGRPPSARARRRALRAAIRSGPVGSLRPLLAAAIPPPTPAGVEDALGALERAAYGPAPTADDAAARRRLIDAVAAAGRRPTARAAAALPGLNPPVAAEPAGSPG